MTTAPHHPPDRRVRFEALATVVVEPLQRYLLRRAAREVADDALADTLLTVWRRLDDVPADEPLLWCYGVARRCLANQQRSARRQLRLVGRLTAHLPAQRTTAPPADAALVGDPELAAAMAGLGADDRELLTLWAWEQLEPAEIAVVLGITANAVSIRLHRAKQRLRLAHPGKDLPSAGHAPAGLAEEH